MTKCSSSSTRIELRGATGKEKARELGTPLFHQPTLCQHNISSCVFDVITEHKSSCAVMTSSYVFGGLPKEKPLFPPVSRCHSRRASHFDRFPQGEEDGFGFVFQSKLCGSRSVLRRVNRTCCLFFFFCLLNIQILAHCQRCTLLNYVY